MNRAVVVMLVVHLAAQALPHVDELTGQAPGALALQPQAAVLPVAEAPDDVGVLIGQVGAAGEGHIAIDAGDFPVVAVVEVQPVHVVVYRIKDDDLHTGTAQGIHPLRRHAHHAAEVVENQLDLHALPALAAQHIGQPVPYLALGHNEVLQEDEALRLLHGGQHILQKVLAGGQIYCVCRPVKGKAFIVQIGRQRSPLGHALPQLFYVQAALFLLAGGLLGPRQLFQVQALGLPPAVPQPVEHQAHHRQE